MVKGSRAGIPAMLRGALGSSRVQSGVSQTPCPRGVGLCSGLSVSSPQSVQLFHFWSPRFPYALQEQPPCRAGLPQGPKIAGADACRLEHTWQALHSSGQTTVASGKTAPRCSVLESRSGCRRGGATRAWMQHSKTRPTVEPQEMPGRWGRSCGAARAGPQAP
ncbi:hypothetical protein NDU88_002207 [Pleurodeles waltl]|uniref:Uncharacterized protein n=1 Tax=Pleurodeles waltl TaxID=8319 RepID=A0AAV7LEY5_PLEWA|nr:hypothetical protein NDU88_002207 [Pleurodeles waltl]